MLCKVIGLATRIWHGIRPVVSSNSNTFFSGPMNDLRTFDKPMGFLIKLILAER